METIELERVVRAQSFHQFINVLRILKTGAFGKKNDTIHILYTFFELNIRLDY